MAYGMDDRVREQATFAGGTIAVTLPNVAVSGDQTFLAGWGASGTGEYCLVIGTQWEVGYGTLNAGGTLLTRVDADVYDGSSGAGTRVNFNPGTLDCFGVVPAELAHHLNMREVSIADSATPDIGAVRTSAVSLAGTTTITGLGSSKNKRRTVRFTTTRTLTHSAFLILPNGANIITGNGDIGEFRSDVNGNWRCLSYTFATAASLSLNLALLRVFKKGTGSPFTTPGANNFTPSATALFFAVENVGGGGGGGGAAGTASMDFTGGGGGSGGYSARIVTLAQIQADASFTAGHITVTIGAAGAGGAAGANNGGAGTATSFGALVIANGGAGGLYGSAGQVGRGGAAGVTAGGVGDEVCAGAPGQAGGWNALSASVQFSSGAGGSSRFGGGAVGVINNEAGIAAGNYGSGGSGGSSYNGTSTTAGGGGSAGMCRVWELCTA